MALINDPELADHVRCLRSHAASVSEVQRNAGKGYLLPEYNELGFNYRMTDIQGAIGCAQIKKLDYITARRTELAHRYDRLLPQAVPCVRTPFVPDGYTHIYQTYCTMVLPEAVKCSSVDEANAFRNEWMDRLEQNGIATRQGTHALHTLGYYVKKYGYRHEDLPGAYACDRLSLAIPLYVEMTEEDQDYVIEQMAEISKELLKTK
jgi:dTDP-4-amino-4,6-dideoxygalactose transaminase